ncbi:DUF4321 domain-containing protein [Alkaliphilus sp. MSJ-5]|uniref:DUF4321 domain-containing protein n=1 Tax=Alkaliphilus flagellatus TaxID=2841507 RepID=A0ABS6G7U5_9FIRM|nr:DUF4321 domain-containing protein [Alkaliphilus flagellatus]MBU5677698.1 DUF4321 domain-containing protein [Alkaliphilus flagellatus]
MGKLRNSWLLILFVITGVILGSLIGSFFQKTLPFLNYGPEPLGLKNIEINLGIIYFQITLLIKINIASLIGLLLAVIIFNRL